MAAARLPASRPRHVPLVAVVGAVAGIAVAACGNDSPLPPPADTTTTVTGAPATTVPPATDTTGTTAADTGDGGGAIGADAYQVRSDEAVGGQFQVQVTNRSGEPFTVVGVRLQSEGFTTLAFEPKSSVFAPGQRTDLTTPYGDVVCGADLASSAAALRVERADGGVDEVAVPFDSRRVLERIHRRECDAEAFAAAVDMHLGPMDPGEAAMITTLVLERRASAETIVVDDTRGSVLITPLFAGSAGRELAAGADRLEIPYRFEVRSCLPHLLADVKKPFDFTVYLRIGDAEQHAVALATTEDERDRLWDHVLAFCDAQ